MADEMPESLQQFGGEWTTEKLERLRKYLVAYQQALKNQPFTLYYVDAFAGTGYNTPKSGPDDTSPLFADLVGSDARTFADGSARIALRIPTPFDHYIFVERDPDRHAELVRLKSEFPRFADRITAVHEEANGYLTSSCRSVDWLKARRRAVVFLDPFGMQVAWGTLHAIAATQAIDLWLLFPLGIGVNRMLPGHGQIPPGWRRRLDAMFGEPDWYEAFYETRQTPDLFGISETTVKKADFAGIARYFVKRLKTIFPHVADNPLPLFNSANCPLYLLCFAAANPGSGGPLAKRIAEHILKA